MVLKFTVAYFILNFLVPLLVKYDLYMYFSYASHKKRAITHDRRYITMRERELLEELMSEKHDALYALGLSLRRQLITFYSIVIFSLLYFISIVSSDLAIKLSVAGFIAFYSYKIYEAYTLYQK